MSREEGGVYHEKKVLSQHFCSHSFAVSPFPRSDTLHSRSVCLETLVITISQAVLLSLSRTVRKECKGHEISNVMRKTANVHRKRSWIAYIGPLRLVYNYITATALLYRYSTRQTQGITCFAFRACVTPRICPQIVL